MDRRRNLGGSRLKYRCGPVLEIGSMPLSLDRLCLRLDTSLADATQTRNLSLPGAVYQTTADEAARFLIPSLGDGVFETSSAKTLWDVRKLMINPREVQRRVAQLI